MNVLYRNYQYHRDVVECELTVVVSTLPRIVDVVVPDVTLSLPTVESVLCVTKEDCDDSRDISLEALSLKGFAIKYVKSWHIRDR